MGKLPALLCGAVLFLFGMALLGEYLQKLAGGKVERRLRRLTENRWRGALLGFGVTAIIQSSSAATVLTVSLADAGVLTLGQTVPVIIGSNVGTTVTAWLLCLRSGDSGLGAALTAAMAVLGLTLYLAVPRRRSWGGLLLGLFLLLLGMEQMSAAALPLAGEAAFARLLELASDPLAGALLGACFTGILQSSSASIGLVQAFAAAGAVNWSVGVPLVMGANIGTCVTVLLASIGGGPTARNAALAHLRFNLLGVGALLPLWLLLGGGRMDSAMSAATVAAVHTGFNLISALILLPFSDRLAERRKNRAEPQKAPPGGCKN